MVRTGNPVRRARSPIENIPSSVTGFSLMPPPSGDSILCGPDPASGDGPGEGTGPRTAQVPAAGRWTSSAGGRKVWS